MWYEMKIEEAVVCKCLECKRGVAAFVTACDDAACALHPFRLWQPKPVKTKRTLNISDEERERRRARGKRLGELNRAKKMA